ncbi:protein kinase [Klebsiella quasipneumoniae]|uniref:protein kinase n=1 Tax=Klebsiella quasipneumoniae TaxID=1463165 RepID=UPI003556DE31
MSYNSKSCSSLEKAYYTPVEAALRWCNLIAHEVLILERVGLDVLPGVGMFPQWPCLRVNAEKILDAIHNGEIAYGRDGKTVSPGEQVAKHRLTIRHSELKTWMAKNYPNQKPSFLFDAVEQQLHTGITVEAYQTLQAENKRLNIRLDNAVKTFQQQKHEISELQGERDSLRQMVDNSVQNIDGRSETTYLNIIGGLLSLMLGNSPSGEKLSRFANQGAIISSMLAHFEGIPGISVRTLEGKFSEANKSLKKR